MSDYDYDVEVIAADHVDPALRCAGFNALTPALVFAAAAEWFERNDGAIRLIDVGWHDTPDAADGPWTLNVYFYPEDDVAAG
jgi:hypothetical protein